MRASSEHNIEIQLSQTCKTRLCAPCNTEVTCRELTVLRALGFIGVRLLSFDTDGDFSSDVFPFLEDLGVPLLSRDSLPNMFASHRMLLLNSSLSD